MYLNNFVAAVQAVGQIKKTDASCLNALQRGEEVGNRSRQNQAKAEQDEERRGHHHLPVLSHPGVAPPPALATATAAGGSAVVAATARAALDEGGAVQRGRLNRVREEF